MSEWRLIAEGLYEVSSDGRVRRVGGRELTPRRMWTGYLRYAMSVRSVTRRAYAHRLVAEAFIGPRPDGHQVNHRDGCKTNNAVSNLEYVTPRENTRHAHAMGLARPRRGDNHPLRLRPELILRGEAAGNARLTDAQVKAIRERYGAPPRITHRELADAYGVSPSNISVILSRKSRRST